MTIHVFGSELGSFTPSESAVNELTGSGNTNFTRCAMESDGDARYFEGTFPTGFTTAYMHIDWQNQNSAVGTATRFIWYNAAGDAKIRIRQSDSAKTIGVEYWNGAAWTAAGSTVSLILTSSRSDIDLKVVCNTASGSIQLFVAGTERITATGIDLSGIAQLQKFRWFGASSGGTNYSTYISQVVVADESTIGMRVMTLVATGAGSDSAWGSGTYASIDETVNSDTDYISAASNGLVSTFAQTPKGSMTGYTIRAIAVTARAKRGATGPANLRHALRVSGTNYFSASDIALGEGYTPTMTVWETSPATAVAWTNAEMTGLQFGVKAIT